MIRRRIVGLSTLLGFWAASIGFPVANLPEKADEDFPCRGHHCGCLNAEMCRTNCCCQKPATVRSCCAHKAAKTVQREVPVEGCSQAEAPQKQTTGLVITALACKGLTAHWVSLNLPVNGDSLIAIGRPMPTRVRTPLHSDRLSPLSSLEPEAPPPRA